MRSLPEVSALAPLGAAHELYPAALTGTTLCAFGLYLNTASFEHTQRRLRIATDIGSKQPEVALLLTQHVAGAEALAAGPAGGVEAPAAAVADGVHR